MDKSLKFKKIFVIVCTFVIVMTYTLCQYLNYTGDNVYNISLLSMADKEYVFEYKEGDISYSNTYKYYDVSDEKCYIVSYKDKDNVYPSSINGKDVGIITLKKVNYFYIIPQVLALIIIYYFMLKSFFKKGNLGFQERNKFFILELIVFIVFMFIFGEVSFLNITKFF